MLKIMILIVILACIGPFFIKGPNGKPLLSLDDFKPDLTATKEELVPSGPTTVYKWQDENGVWQFSSDPADMPGAETMELDGNINTMEAFKAPSKVQRPETRMPSLPSLPGMTTISTEQMDEMMETVNGLQETADQRQEQIRKATGG
ncbi:MAG: DUF4124 domain-containing protein [Pseudomonadales bacterium]|nr:DUF4124 domain-containing protein [Pseudomonadales bacterium]